METIYWALGTTLLFLLAILIIPLGFTIKGKLSVVVTSFLLALGGIAAASNFPLWITALMVLALIFFAAYFINQRYSSFFYQQTSPDTYYDNEVSESDEHERSNNQLNEENWDKSETLSPNQVQLNVAEPVNELETTINEEDISFLNDRNLSEDSQTEMTQSTPDLNYLLEIESLLEMDEDKTQNPSENVLLEEITQLSSTINGDNKETLKPMDEEYLLDILRANEEVKEEKEEKVL